MINLSMSESEMEKKEESVLYETSKYPYGLKIQIDHETYEKIMGNSEPPKVGSKMIMHAQVEVCSVYADTGKDGESKYSMGLQITDMELKQSEAKKSVESIIYSKD
jgi:hypothetical protein